MKDFSRAVIQWQLSKGRHHLPWQQQRTPYRVWISEIMLQQTQVQTVLPYFHRFMQRFPTVAALASAPLQEVMAIWAGLGYYRRAAHLHQCAQTIMQQYQGQFPTTARQWAQLPGIGPSTAAAIAAFCFGERAAILDGNVQRVLARVLAYGEDLSRSKNLKALWLEAQGLLPEMQTPVKNLEAMRAYTQGMMDLGAGVCLSRQPLCETCPVQAHCQAFSTATILSYPHKISRLVRQEVQLHWLVARASQDVYLCQRPSRGIWGGLWSFPEFSTQAALHQAVLPLLQCVQGMPEDSFLQAFRQQGGGAVTLQVIRHELTHRSLYIHPHQFQLPASLLQQEAFPHDAWRQLPAGQWFPMQQALNLGLPTPVKKLLQAMNHARHTSLQQQ
jgi:A/G-specific adenine glycosylase